MLLHGLEVFPQQIGVNAMAKILFARDATGAVIKNAEGAVAQMTDVELLMDKIFDQWVADGTVDARCRPDFVMHAGRFSYFDSRIVDTESGIPFANCRS